MEKLSVRTSSRIEFVDITSEVSKAVSRSEVKEGMCLIYCPHTTAGITINEGADPDVMRDIKTKLDQIVPRMDNYLHCEGNSDSHIKSSIIGCSEIVPISNGELVLGTWQKIYFAEFDGPRHRNVILQIIGK